MGEELKDGKFRPIVSHSSPQIDLAPQKLLFFVDSVLTFYVYCNVFLRVPFSFLNCKEITNNNKRLYQPKAPHDGHHPVVVGIGGSALSIL